MKNSCCSAKLGGSFRAAVVPARHENPNLCTWCSSQNLPQSYPLLRRLLYSTMQARHAAFSVVAESVRRRA